MVLGVSLRCCHVEIAKALILAGQIGDDRPWPSAPGPKHLFPVANRPILHHNLEGLRAAGVLEAAILAEPDTHEAIERAVGDGSAWGLTIRQLEWSSSDCLREALTAGQDFVEEEPVLVQRGDALLRERMHPHIAAFARERLDTLALRLDTTAPRIPRPPSPGYLLSPKAVSILLDDPALAPNPIAGVRARGGRVRVQRVQGMLPCSGGEEYLLESNRHVLEGLESDYDPAALDDCRVQGRVIVHPTAEVRRSLLRGPVIIGAGARVVDAYVGPYTSIGAGVTLESAEIEYSIVLDDAQLRYVGTRLESSIIGRGARIARGFDLPGALKINIGDGAEVMLR
jgi:glucose-1-phosphate thymidylyltransferase